ncbi:MAG: hypothetical protein A2X22_06315 [Bacteroidetes bacterium GWF2_49_14]|nr:MAG: hypothetical protein A2X22_06315 [Bacteroidetes bacterium GWF2_49_14]HBB90931.1 hypothetical protein [Bacteroidales bacterium]
MNKFSGMLRALIAMALLTSMAGCHVGKRITKTERPATEDEKLIKAVYDANLQPKYIEIRFTGKTDLDEDKVSFMGSAKLVKDSLIWVSLRSPIGIEIGRFMASPDSIWLVSKILKIKEKGNWRMMRELTRHELDFNSLQGILTQSLFTAGGISENIIQNDLLVRRQDNIVWIAWKPGIEDIASKSRYLAQFRVDPGTQKINEADLKDGAGRWVSKAQFLYTRENVIKKIEINGMDESHNYIAELNIVTYDVKENVVINFEKF